MHTVKIHGPTYHYQGECLDQPTAIIVSDHHYDEEQQQFQIKKLLENSLCDPQLHVVIFDHVLQHDDILKSYNLICLPGFLADTCTDFSNQQICTDWNHKTHIFNFMINKQRLNREILLLLVEHFQLTNFVHSLVWKQAQVGINNLCRITNNTLYQDLVNRTIIKIPVKKYLLGHETLLDFSLRYHHITNSENYQHLLQKTVFEPSCVSLITEPSFFEKETIVTEKTIMAIYGGTIPIWVGGWRIPDYLRGVGFDVFDDVIDHSYQNLSDPWDRCYYAIEKNLEVLKNKQKITDFIENNHTRLQKNLELVQKNIFTSIVSEGLSSYPKNIKDNVNRYTSNSNGI